MANTPIISDSNNASYDGKLSTTNGFYRGEAWNLGASSGTTLVVSTVRYINSTFANAGNLQGIALALSSVNNTALVNPYGVMVSLEQIMGACTMDATTDLVTLASHGLANGTIVEFSTTGALLTGITAGTKYYVVNTAANTFQISTSLGGAAINFTGTQSGTHTLYAVRTSSELTTSQIQPEFIQGQPYGTSGLPLGGYITPFKFTPYAVDTTVSKWRFRIEDGKTTGATSIWRLFTSDATNPFYCAWCDTKVTATDNDILGIVDKIIIDKSFTTGGAFGTGQTDVFNAGFICRNTDISNANVALLEWENSATGPAASYTFTFGGSIIMARFSGFRVGTSTDGLSSLDYYDNKGLTNIGNCQNKPVQVSVRLKIKHADYYSGTSYTLPTVTVTYDNGTTETGVSTATTDDQQILVNFTPLTSEPFITIKISTATDAVSPNNSVYIGENMFITAAGTMIDTTTLSSWANAVPLGSFRTFPAPEAGWNALINNYQATGTFGSIISKIYKYVRALF